MTTWRTQTTDERPACHDELSPGNARRRPSRSSAIILVLTGMVMLALVSLVSLNGGWNSIIAERDISLPNIKVNESVYAEPFEARFIRASITDDLKSLGIPKQDGKRGILIYLETMITTDFSVSSDILSKSLTLQASELSEVYALPEDSEKPDPRPIIFRGQDLQQNRAVVQRSFQPGLTQYVVAAWAQNKTEPLPTELTLTLSEFTYRASSVYGGMYWFDKKEKFSISIPVEKLEQ